MVLPQYPSLPGAPLSIAQAMLLLLPCRTLATQCYTKHHKRLFLEDNLLCSVIKAELWLAHTHPGKADPPWADPPITGHAINHHSPVNSPPILGHQYHCIANIGTAPTATAVEGGAVVVIERDTQQIGVDSVHHWSG